MNPRILYCHCANARVLPEENRAAALEALCASGLPLEAVADLCGCSARRDPLLRRLADAGPLIVAACHPRTVRWLFTAADAPLPQETTQYLNLRTETPEAIRAAVDALPQAGEPRDAGALRNELEAAAVPPGGWNPWAPVVDYDRCTGCMQCLSFCLFGVYGVDEQARVEVRHPAQCKTQCPACSRVCPEAAILFPKHPSSAINGGTETATAEQHEAMKVDLSALLGGDLYARLRERSGGQPRFSADRDPEQALRERRHHLAALAASGEIPPEVWNSLPAPEELARLAAEARARAQAAVDQRQP